jgi:hypothetical protein
MSITTTSAKFTSTVIAARRDMVTAAAARGAVEAANAAKAAVVRAALDGGDLAAFAAAICPVGEFGRVSCPSSMEFGDEDINFHGKRLGGLGDGHEIDATNLRRKVEAFERTELRLKRDARRGDGREIAAVHTQCTDLRRLLLKHQAAVVRVDAMIAILKEELAMRETTRDDHMAKVAAERAARIVAVIQPETGLPAKAYKRPVRVKKIAVRRDDIRVESFEALKSLLTEEDVEETTAA